MTDIEVVDINDDQDYHQFTEHDWIEVVLGIINTLKENKINWVPVLLLPHRRKHSRERRQVRPRR